ncbi:FadR/GntR family transcriptional regulator [Streptomyces profundus]|uniref:FadR/GntR family transcriptional regulator n=1 Tax=Streptomyces profundus TaxID=2867410 RepID=UPI001D15E630|nr:FCD domain-containing protein [Streptomyces sp. MA3_2.13]UED84114.1 FCD domain-containing protein [Streptomyces sp. MA3_2.13]
MSEEPTPPGSAPTTLEAAVSGIEVLIFDELDPGMSLPSEGELATALGVSRLTVREALKVLAARGLVALSKGRRPRVLEPDSSVFSGHFTATMRRDPGALLEFLDVREALEVQAVTLAARHASRSALQAAQSALDGMADAAADLSTPAEVARYHRCDVAFHEALALASGNRVLVFLLEGLRESLRHSFERGLEGNVLRGRSVQDVLATHRAVLAKVRARDARGAADAMRECLRDARNDLRAALDPTNRARR